MQPSHKTSGEQSGIPLSHKKKQRVIMNTYSSDSYKISGFTEKKIWKIIKIKINIAKLQSIGLHDKTLNFMLFCFVLNTAGSH